MNTEYEYGCCECQNYHGESDGPIYNEHLMQQSKHGLRTRSAGGHERAQKKEHEEEKEAG